MKEKVEEMSFHVAVGTLCTITPILWSSVSVGSHLMHCICCVLLLS